MRKFVTVLMMIAMLSMPGNSAFATRAGSSGGSGGEGKGGYDANVSLQLALARPAFFITIALTQILVMTTLFAPRIVIGKRQDAVLLTLAMTGTLTLAYFLFVMKELYRYIIYQVLFALPYFNQYDAGSKVSSRPVEEAEWDISDPDARAEMLAANHSAITAANEAELEERQRIQNAVERALRDPELAKKYLKYASPAVRAGVQRALDDQFEERVRNRFSVEEGSGGDFEAFEVQ